MCRLLSGLVAAIMCFAWMGEPAEAVTAFTFSFGNDDGAIDGTVEGIVELSPIIGDTFTATSLIVTSSPPELGQPPEIDVFDVAPFVLANLFTVVDGDVTSALFAATGGPDADFQGIAFGVGPVTLGVGATLTSFGDPLSANGVLDLDGSSLEFAAVPLPGTLGLLAMGLVPLVIGRRRSQRVGAHAA